MEGCIQPKGGKVGGRKAGREVGTEGGMKKIKFRLSARQNFSIYSNDRYNSKIQFKYNLDYGEVFISVELYFAENKLFLSFFEHWNLCQELQKGKPFPIRFCVRHRIKPNAPSIERKMEKQCRITRRIFKPWRWVINSHLNSIFACKRHSPGTKNTLLIMSFQKMLNQSL